MTLFLVSLNHIWLTSLLRIIYSWYGCDDLIDQHWLQDYKGPVVVMFNHGTQVLFQGSFVHQFISLPI